MSHGAAVPAAKRAEILAAVTASLEQGIPLTVAVRSIRAPRSTVYDWLKADPVVQEAIRQARDLGYDHIAHQCLAIADDRSEDVVFDADGNPHPNGAAVLRAKVRIETRLKLLSKWDVNRYGESRTVKLEGELQQTVRHTIDPRSLPSEQREALRSLIEHAVAQGLLPSPDTVDAEYEEVAEDEPSDG
jgi:hypothetical protein